MRTETYNASQYLVYRLQHAQAVTNIRDEGDVILLDLVAGHQVMILLIERGMKLSEVRYHFSTNTQQGIHTLMLLWVDMFLPPDGSDYELDDWMVVLDSLHGGKIYGYEVAGREAFFFPVHLRGDNNQRRVRFGTMVNYAAIGGQTRHTQNPYMPGEWLVGGFEFQQQAYRDASHSAHSTQSSALAVHYETLGVPDNADKDTVKRAYRALARLYHPDVNEAGESDERMKRINEAYQAILQRDA